MHAAGVYSHKMTPLSSLDMLSFFTMSTDKFKPPLGAPRQQNLGLICNMHFTTHEKMTFDIINGEAAEVIDDEVLLSRPGLQTNPNDSSLWDMYQSTHLLCDAINSYFSTNQSALLCQKIKNQSAIGIHLLYEY